MTELYDWDKAVVTKRMFEHHLKYPDNKHHLQRFRKLVWSLNPPTLHLYSVLVKCRK